MAWRYRHIPPDPASTNDGLTDIATALKDLAAAHRDETRLTLMVGRRAHIINEFHALFIRLLMDAIAACAEDWSAAVNICRQAVAITTANN